MVKFDLVLTDGRIHVETIDDAESTPGSSRQYTRFNAECKPELEQVLSNLIGADSTDARVDAIMFTLAKHNFMKEDVIHLMDEDGHLTNRLRVFIDSVEP
jgi:hypothetical protein